MNSTLRDYLPLVPKMEGTKYEWDTDMYRKFGISVQDIKDATGKTVSEERLKNMEWGDPYLVQAVGRYWNKMWGNLYPQSIANTITDHAFNKGIGTATCMVQTMLKIRYKANIVVDGKFGTKTATALKVAVAKYGELHVYNSFYAMRKNYYNGKAIADSSGCKRIACTRPVCKVIASSRLDKYFPPMHKDTNGATFAPPQYEDWTTPVADDGLTDREISGTLTTTVQNAFKGDGVTQNYTPYYVGGALVLTLALAYAWYRWKSH